MNPWLDATSNAAQELAETALGCEFSIDSATDRIDGADLTGCFIALAGEETSVQIGVASDGDGCQALAQSLLGEESALPEADVTDALGEIANILAGGVKKRMAGADPTMRLSLPLVLQGTLHVTEHQKLALIPVHFGEIPARLLVVRGVE